MSAYDLHIGIDYSGAQAPESRLRALQVYAATEDEPERVLAPSRPANQHRNWSRREIAGWLIGLVREGTRFLAGIDHGFSFPVSYFRRHGLSNWDEFLDDFGKHWPTHAPATSVDSIRREEPQRTGASDELRLCERWTSSAKSVFRFDVQGQVAKSTHAGIPWLWHIRRAVGDRVHFWPFDGWEIPPGTSVIAEVYPSILRNRYPREGRTADEQDAYSVARWLQETCRHGFLDRYLHPPLTSEEREVAGLEGWILGIA